MGFPFKDKKKIIPSILSLGIFAITTFYISTYLINKPLNYNASAFTNELSFIPSDDSYVDQNNPEANNGSSTQFRADGSPVVKSFLKFNVSGVNGSVVQATLKIYANSAHSRGFDVGGSQVNWTESTLNYNTQPPSTSPVVASSGPLTAGNWYSINVLPLAVGNGEISFVISTTSSTAMSLASRESSFKPELKLVVSQETSQQTPTQTLTPTPPVGVSTTPTLAVLSPTTTPTEVFQTTTPSPSPTLASDPVIVAAGDMVADLSRTSSSKHKEVSDLIVNLNPLAVLALGDVQYESGQYDNFVKYYDPTWGRFVDKTYPAVGNHEYLTAGAKGYYDYFTQKWGGEGNTTTRPGARNQGYYSFDIGSWHLISLNTQCSQAGGCGAGSPQEKWLRADLAAHPNKCVLAFWHIPLYSSGGRANSNSKAFWQALYDYNADLVLVGHDHTYERFGPQNANAQLDLTRGIRSFVVGTGGKNLTRFASIARNSEIFHNESFGVLKLTLRSSSFDWDFVPLPGGGFSDAGSANCH